MNQYTAAILANTQKPGIKEILAQFFKEVKGSGFYFTIPKTYERHFEKIPAHIKVLPQKKVLDQADLVLSFGGDGTILNTAQLVGHRETPILGINLGGLGFLTTTSVKTAKKHITEFFKGKLVTDRRSLLRVEIDGESKKYDFLNDLVIDKAGFSRLIRVTTHVDAVLLNSFMADGLVIATPTGSTAYSLANGGPIVMPSTNAFILNPVCPHTLSNRPIVISDEVSISLNVESELGRFNVFGDGNHIGSYPVGTQIRIRKTDYTVRLVQIKEKDYYTILREKLGWGEDIRGKNRRRRFNI